MTEVPPRPLTPLTPAGTRVLVHNGELSFCTTTSDAPQETDGVLSVRCVGVPKPVPALALEVLHG